MLPGAVCIGFPRSGTTWLHETLQAHPQVHLSPTMKELHFFDLYYDRGLAWYREEFAAAGHGAIGVDVTPSYVFSAEALERLSVDLPDARLLVMLRFPVDRLVSGFLHRQQTKNYKGSFEAYLEERPVVLERMRYSTQLVPWIEAIGRSAMHFELLEDVRADPGSCLGRLAAFLGIDPEAFPAGAGTSAANASFSPRAPRLYATALRVQRGLRGRNADGVASFAKRLGVQRLLGRSRASGGAVAMTPPTRARLERIALREADDLEALLGIDLSRWRDEATQA